jgi:acetyltransferase
MALSIRAIEPRDAGAFQAFVEALSPQARYHRFLAPVRELAPALLAMLVAPDQARHFGFAAFSGAQLIGEARAVALGASGRSEFALAVADAWQRRGIGRRLLEVLAAAVRGAGQSALQGEISHGNAAMIDFVRHNGFRLASCPGDARLVLAERAA